MAASNSADNTYTWKAGTSMATPQVAGLAALLYASGMTDVNAVRERIKATADPLPGTAGMGAGRINVYRALTGLDPNAPPVAQSVGQYAGVEGSPIQFDGSASFDPNGKGITSWTWSFGDGTTGSGATVSKTYADNGSYSVTLAVADPASLVGTKAITTLVSNVAPSASASLTRTSILSGESTTLQAAFSDPGANDAPWSWTVAWGNGSTGGSTSTQGATESTRRFCAPGSYAPILTVADKDGGAGQAATALAVGYNAMSVDMPGPINTKANGTLPVTLFPSAALDVAAIDLATVVVGDGIGTDAGVVVKNNGTFQAAIENGQLVVHVDRQQLAALGNLSPTTTQVVVRARLKDGCTEFRGAAAVVVK
jgi:PKD repeat protein